MMRIFDRSILVLAVVCFSSLGILAQTGGVKGTVRTVKGNGIADATVTAREKGEDVKSTKADSKGNFVLEGLRSGTYNLVFSAPGYSTGTLYNVEVKKNSIRDLAERLILRTDQGTQVIIKGSVFDKFGRSLTAAEIKIERIDSTGSKKVGNTTSTVTGEFTFRQPEGSAKFRITASFKGVSGSKEVEVDSAAIYRLAISLDVSRDGKEE